MANCFKRFWMRILALILVITFLSEQITYASPHLPSIHISPAENKEINISTPLFQISIPEKLAVIDSVISGQGPAIVHIQTPHGNAEAQKQIQAILQFLYQQYGFDVLFLEGSGVKLNPKLLNFIPERPEMNEKFLAQLMEKALIKGPELFLFHQQNAQAYVPKIGMRKEVTSDIRAVFNAPNENEAQRFLNMAVGKIQAGSS